MKRMYFLAIMMIISFLPYGISNGQEIDAKVVIAKMKEALEPSISSTRKLSFVLKRGDEVIEQWVAREARKKFPEGKRSLLAILGPKRLKGAAYLVYELETGKHARYMYSNVLDRVQEIPPLIMADESFFNTDFTYRDLGFIDASGKHRLLGEEEYGGLKAFKVESIPQNQWLYSRIINWICKDTLLPIERHFYDVGGNLWKKQTFGEVVKFAKVPTPSLIQMVDVRSGTSTEFKIADVCYGAKLPDDIFEPSKMSKLLDTSSPYCVLQEFGQK